MSETRTSAPFPLGHGARHLKRAKSPACRAGAEGESQMKLGPRPAGRPWTPTDDAQLLPLLASGLDRPSIARKLKRSVHAIASRKRHLNQGRLERPGPEAKGQA